MANEDINFTDEQYQILEARADLLTTQIDLFSTLDPGSPPHGYLVKDTHANRTAAVQLAPAIRKLILECKKEVSYKESFLQKRAGIKAFILQQRRQF